ncbi:MAG: DUF1854 domain-containing protein, partial [Comamonadaceae bacterium]|nr:DUF1854 domain-containing protein [Comamonadaceae bacterium]
MSAATITLHRNTHGRLCLTLADGTLHEDITPVRAFPIAAPEEAIALVGSNGKEVYWIDQLAELPAPMQQLL